jgi:hypothetical protein
MAEGHPSPDHAELTYDDVRAAITALRDRHVEVAILTTGEPQRTIAELAGRLVAEQVVRLTTADVGDDSGLGRRVYTLDGGGNRQLPARGGPGRPR